jgi:hypothetical protein
MYVFYGYSPPLIINISNKLFRIRLKEKHYNYLYIMMDICKYVYIFIYFYFKTVHNSKMLLKKGLK